VARKPTVSPTKISIYLACPVRYVWTYVDPRGKWYLRGKSYYSFGTTLHNVLQRFHDEGDAGVRTVDQALAAMEESWIDVGFTSAEEMQEAFAEGKEILSKYVAAAMQEETPAKTLFVEKMLRYEFPEFALIGRIDRVDEYPDGTLEIVDYKSGRETVSVDDVRSDIAMAVYQLLVRRKYPDQPVRATIIALRSGDRASYSMTDEELSEFESDVHRLGIDIVSTGHEDHVPTPKPLCPRCDFLPLCSKVDGFDLAVLDSFASG